MRALRFPIDVIMERQPLANRWVDEVWRPFAVEPCSVPEVETTPTQVADDASGVRRWRIGGLSIELHPTEAEGYYLNLTSPAPCVFVMWRMFDHGEPKARPVLVTVSYNEAGRLLDGGERVDNVPISPVILQELGSFVVMHYKPEPRRKVKRNDPFAADSNRRGGPRG